MENQRKKKSSRGAIAAGVFIALYLVTYFIIGAICMPVAVLFRICRIAHNTPALVKCLFRTFFVNSDPNREQSAVAIIMTGSTHHGVKARSGVV